jgi:hypothetical protein
MSPTGFYCSNPYCDRHGKALLSERGLFYHLDSSPQCRRFSSSRPPTHNSNHDAFNIGATTSSLAPVIHNSLQNSGDVLYEETHLHDANDDAAIPAGSSHCDSHCDVLDEDDSSILSNNEREDDSESYSESYDPEENGEEGSDSNSESYSSEMSEDHNEVGCDNNTPGILTNDTTEVPSSCERPSILFDFASHNDGVYTPRQWIQDWVQWSKKSSDISQMEQSDDNRMLPDNLDLLTKLISDPNYLPGWTYVSATERAEIRLMSTLNEIKGCPLYVYDSVIQWAKTSFGLHSNSESENDDFPLSLLRNRKEYLDVAVEFADTSDMLPKTIKKKLPSCLQTVPLTTISYLANLYNCLTSRDLVNDDSILLPGKTPHDDPPRRKSAEFDDINTGSRYLDSWFAMKKDDIDFPLGDLFFVDKSVYDVNGRLSAEPVNHTFTLLNRRTRYMPSAWYSMGCIPNQKGLNYGSDSTPKIRDYHYILDEIFREYRELQSNVNGILWPLLFRGKLYMVRFRPYVMACLGDTPGQNVMTGKMNSSRCQRPCRYCDIEKDYLSDPWQPYTIMTKELQKTIQDDDHLLTKFSYKKVSVMWDSLNFGVASESIHSNVPGELLHAFQKGLLVRVIECLLITKSQTSAVMTADQKRLSKIQTKQKGAIREDVVLEEMIKNGAFGGKWTQMVDNLSRALGQMIAQQSDHNMPRTHFTQGIVNHSKTTAAEQQGIVFLFNIILCSTWAVEKNGLGFRLGTKRLGGYISILEKLMCLEELLKCHSGKNKTLISREQLPMIVRYVKQLLETIKSVADRQVGDGFDIIKFHLINHMLEDDIPKYGSPANVSGGPGETQFKKNFKNPGSTTQLNDTTFIQQVCMRKFQHHTTERCAQRVSRIEDCNSDAYRSNPYSYNLLHDAPLVYDKPSPSHFGSVIRETKALGSTVDKKLTRDTNVKGESILPHGPSCCHYLFYTCLDPSNISNHSGGDEMCSDKCGNITASTTTHSHKNTSTCDIAYCGKRHGSKYSFFTKGEKEVSRGLVDINMQKVGTKGCPSLGTFNDGFRMISEFLKSTFGKAGYQSSIRLYTVYRVPPTKYQDVNTIYRGDPCCHLGLKERFDWALFDTKKGLRVGQMLSFLHMTAEMIDKFNSNLPYDHGKLVDKAGDFALVQLFNKEVPGLVDTTIHKHSSANVMQANSVLLFFGTKQQRNGKPVTRLLPLCKILRPLVVLPDFHPSFSPPNTGCSIVELNVNTTRSNSFIVVRPRDLWHELFVQEAIMAYNKKKKKEGTRG